MKTQTHTGFCVTPTSYRHPSSSSLAWSEAHGRGTFNGGRSCLVSASELLLLLLLSCGCLCVPVVWLFRDPPIVWSGMWCALKPVFTPCAMRIVWIGVPRPQDRANGCVKPVHVASTCNQRVLRRPMMRVAIPLSTPTSMH